MPRPPRAALATALGTKTLAVDVGMLDDRPFFNIAGIGFDAHVARLFNQRSQGRRGRLPYVVIGVREGCRYAGKDYRDHARRRHRSARARSSSHLPTARSTAWECRSRRGLGPDDGLLEAVVVEDRSVLARFRDARHLALGSIHRAPQMVMQPIRTAIVESDGEIEYHVDGEPGVARNRLSISVRPGALSVKV